MFSTVLNERMWDWVELFHRWNSSETSQHWPSPPPPRFPSTAVFTCMDATPSACRLENAIKTQISRQTRHSPRTDSPSSSAPSLNIITHIKSKRYKSCHLLPVLAVFACEVIFNVQSWQNNSAPAEWVPQPSQGFSSHPSSGASTLLFFKKKQNLFSVLALEQGPNTQHDARISSLPRMHFAFYLIHLQILLSPFSATLISMTLL